MMRKILMSFLFVTGVSFILGGCNTGDNNANDSNWTDSFEKTQEVEVISSDDSDITTISNGNDIENFVEALKIDEWNLSDIPSGATKGNIFKMYQEDTVKLFRKADKQKKKKDNLIEIATLTSYKDIPYIKFSFKKFSFVFKVPGQVAEYLNSNRY